MYSNFKALLQGEGAGFTLVRAASGSAGIRIVGMAFGFLVGVLLARGLGADGYGTYGVVMSIIAILVVPAEFGLPQLLNREIAAYQLQGDWAKFRGILTWTSRIAIYISIIVVILALAWILISLENNEASLPCALLVGLPLVPLVSFLSIRSAALRGMQLIVRGQVSENIVRPACHSILLLFVFLVSVPMTPELAIGLGVASTAVALLASEVMLRGVLPIEVSIARPKFDQRIWTSSAFPMAMTEGMRIIQGHLLILVLGWMAALSDAGIFRVANSVVLLIGMPISLLNIVSMPIVARLFASNDLLQLRVLLPRIATGMSLGVLALLLPFVIAGPVILNSLFGEQFAASNGPLLVLGLSFLVSSIFGVTSVFIAMAGHPSAVTKATLVSLSILIIVSWPAVAIYGAIGAASSMLLSTIAWNLYLWRYAQINFEIDGSVVAILKAVHRSK